MLADPKILAALIGAIVLPSAASAVDFEKDIQPIFSAHCTKCHGDDKPKSGLSLETPAGILKGGDSGEPVFIVGKSGESHLIHLVSRTDPDEAMPPEGKGKPLSAAQINTLKTWIDEGAKMPAVEEVALTTDHWSFQPLGDYKPPTSGEKWARGPIDLFVRAAQHGKKLAPSPRADRRTLIRRLYLVMHGLPPTPPEVDAFLSDKHPLAWERLVDRVLASPRFGERWARHWLDIVRFAETNGFETNRERMTAYHFRDYVIESFNNDKPYDQFVREQLAGDAIGVPVGTGFLVAGPYDVVKSPDVSLTLMQRQDELADMVNTTGTAFLGLTMGCARCHNHKFDPILQKDYYAMQAVFAGVNHGERAMPRNATPETGKRLAELKRALADREARLQKLRDLAENKSEEPSSLREPVDSGGNVEKFAALQAKTVRFVIHASNSSEPCIDELQVFTSDGRNVALASAGAKASSSGNFQNNQHAFHKLEFINDGKFGNSRSWISNQSGKGMVRIDFAKPEKIERIEWARDRERKFADRTATDYVIEASEDGQNWTPVASSKTRKPFKGGKKDPNAFVAKLDKGDAAKAKALIVEIDKKRKELANLEAGPKAWIGNFSQPGKTHRLYRGDPMAKREVVAPDALAVMGSLGMKVDESEQQRREKLAEWIASPKNPLTARVMVNRLWQFTFGTGIVDTPSDFGANGTNPTHPELLDWMARDFIENGWSIKHLLRQMLVSATFQQASIPRKDARAIDADSRYLWRFPPRRLEAEAIRDSILAVAGTLDFEMGGPGFYLLDVERENVVHYHQKEEIGPAEWRRMIYMFKIRQEQDSVFSAFDCPDGNQVIPKRSRSTTPLQALNLFNSKFVIKQSEILASELGGVRDRINRAFQLFYARTPTEEEWTDAMEFIEDQGFVAFCRALFNTNEFLFIF